MNLKILITLIVGTLSSVNAGQESLQENVTPKPACCASCKELSSKEKEEFLQRLFESVRRAEEEGLKEYRKEREKAEENIHIKTGMMLSAVIAILPNLFIAHKLDLPKCLAIIAGHSTVKILLDFGFGRYSRESWYPKDWNRKTLNIFTGVMGSFISIVLSPLYLGKILDDSTLIWYMLGATAVGGLSEVIYPMVGYKFLKDPKDNPQNKKKESISQ